MAEVMEKQEQAGIPEAPAAGTAVQEAPAKKSLRQKWKDMPRRKRRRIIRIIGEVEPD